MSDTCRWFCPVAVPFAWAVSHSSFEETTSDAPSAGYAIWTMSSTCVYQVTYINWPPFFNRSRQPSPLTWILETSSHRTIMSLDLLLLRTLNCHGTFFKMFTEKSWIHLFVDVCRYLRGVAFKQVFVSSASDMPDECTEISESNAPSVHCHYCLLDFRSICLSLTV